MRIARLSFLGVALALLALAPDALAQRGGGRGGGRGRGGGGLFSAQPGRGGRAAKRSMFGAVRRAQPAPAAKANVPAPTAPKPASLRTEEQQFQDFLDTIERKIKQADRDQAAAHGRVEALGFELPPGVEPGTVEWRALQKPIFSACDYDSGGWISFREARAALELDREEFAMYDRDHDGRIGPREFVARYDLVVAQTGAFRLPKPVDETPKAQPRSADQLRSAFDDDRDGGLDARELAALLRDYGRSELAPELLLATLDDDRSGHIEGPETFQLSRLISVTFVLPAGDELTRPRASSIGQLFGHVVERPGKLDSVAGPPWILGPVPHFLRLDLDGDGFVADSELRALQGSLALGTRVGAVLAALDTDEDGRISEREFLNSLAVARK